jgi:hypothetical protein
MTRDLLFQRVCSVQVGTVRVVHDKGIGPRIAFRVTKTLKKEPNTCEVKIYNLSQATRISMQSVAVPVILSAGYPDNEAVIFSGDARAVDHVREGPDWITRAKCGDGERVYSWSYASESFAPGTSVSIILQHLATTMGLRSGNLEAVIAAGNFRGGLTQFAHGYTLHGRASVELTTLLRTLGCTWSAQNGALQIQRGTSPVPGQFPLLSPDTGLVGSPEHAAPDRKNAVPLVKAKSLLQPSLVCGGAVAIQSQSIAQRQFRVESLEVTGDTASTDWYSTVEVRPL